MIWSYLQADTPDALTTARTALLKPLNTADIKYIKENWVSKESFVCRGLTKMLPNLGVNSTQRAKSMNAVLKKTLSCQITILEACKRLVREVDRFEAKILQAEILSKVSRPWILDLNGFATLLGKITTYAINLIAPEWAAACVPKLNSI